MNKHILIGLFAIITHGILCANNQSTQDFSAEFESIITNTPKITRAEQYFASYRDNDLIEMWYYNSTLALQLIRGNIDTFLDGGKLLSEEEWFGAILEAISLRYLNLPRNSFDAQSWLKNNHNYQEYNNTIRKLFDTQVARHYVQTNQCVTSPSSYIDSNLTHLKKRLSKRIANIEYQLQYQPVFNYTDLGYSMVSLTASGLSAWCGYAAYLKRREFSSFCDMLKQRGIPLIGLYKDPQLYKQYSKLKEANDNAPSMVITAAIISLGLAYLAKEWFINYACDPNRDNEYLPRYKRLLAFISYLEERGYDNWKYELPKQWNIFCCW